MSKVTLNGVLTCAPEDIEIVLSALPEHLRLTRDEPGCICFEVEQLPASPCVFEVRECFADQAAFEAHQLRTRASRWWRLTSHMPRDFSIGSQ